MNDKFVKNFPEPKHSTPTLNVQLTQTIGENTKNVDDLNAS